VELNCKIKKKQKVQMKIVVYKDRKREIINHKGTRMVKDEED